MGLSRGKERPGRDTDPSPTVKEGYCFSAVIIFNRCEMVGTSNNMPVTVGHKLSSFVDVIVEENPRFVIITCVFLPKSGGGPKLEAGFKLRAVHGHTSFPKNLETISKFRASDG
jgi:hypothetical protein